MDCTFLALLGILLGTQAGKFPQTVQFTVVKHFVADTRPVRVSRLVLLTLLKRQKGKVIVWSRRCLALPYLNCLVHPKNTRTTAPCAACSLLQICVCTMYGFSEVSHTMEKRFLWNHTWKDFRDIWSRKEFVIEKYPSSISGSQGSRSGTPKLPGAQNFTRPTQYVRSSKEWASRCWGENLSCLVSSKRRESQALNGARQRSAWSGLRFRLFALCWSNHKKSSFHRRIHEIRRYLEQKRSVHVNLCRTIALSREYRRQSNFWDKLWRVRNIVQHEQCVHMQRMNARLLEENVSWLHGHPVEPDTTTRLKLDAMKKSNCDWIHGIFFFNYLILFCHASNDSTTRAQNLVNSGWLPPNPHGNLWRHINGTRNSATWLPVRWPGRLWLLLGAKLISRTVKEEKTKPHKSVSCQNQGPTKGADTRHRKAWQPRVVSSDIFVVPGSSCIIAAIDVIDGDKLLLSMNMLFCYCPCVVSNCVVSDLRCLVFKKLFLISVRAKAVQLPHNEQNKPNIRWTKLPYSPAHKPSFLLQNFSNKGRVASLVHPWVKRTVQNQKQGLMLGCVFLWACVQTLVNAVELKARLEVLGTCCWFKTDQPGNFFSGVSVQTIDVSVHALTPADIDIVAAVGDSITVSSRLPWVFWEQMCVDLHSVAWKSVPRGLAIQQKTVHKKWLTHVVLKYQRPRIIWYNRKHLLLLDIDKSWIFQNTQA